MPLRTVVFFWLERDEVHLTAEQESDEGMSRFVIGREFGHIANIRTWSTTRVQGCE